MRIRILFIFDLNFQIQTKNYAAMTLQLLKGKCALRRFNDSILTNIYSK